MAGPQRFARHHRLLLFRSIAIVSAFIRHSEPHAGLRTGGDMDRTRTRQRRAAVLAVLLAAALASQPSQAQPWPTRPVRLVVPQSPGASTDLIARVLATRLGEALGQQVVVDNRPGAGSILGTRLVIDAEPDGHTLLVVAASITINPSLHRKPPFDTVRDLAPITQLSVYPNLLVVHPSVQATSVQTLIALARRPGVSLNYGSSGTGTGTHLSAELFRHLTGVALTHVPYKGGGPSVQALLGGEVQLAFATLPSVLPYVRSGKLRALAVTTGERSAVLP
ncbi:MAG: tripartite tricarboxylate transporter substrate-binding protein, partial [bacterium]